LSDGVLDGLSSGETIVIINETQTSPLSGSALASSIGTFAVDQSSSLKAFVISIGTVIEGGSASLSDVVAFSDDDVELDLTQDEGFAFDAVTRNTCGGTLNGTVLTVGPLSANCEVDISVTRVLPDAVWNNFNWNEANWQ